MSDTNPGLPAPSGQPTGITSQPGQPPATAPNPAPTPTTPTAPAATPPAAPTQPTPAAPELATAQRERDQAVAYARQLQSQKDQALAQLRAVTGATPQADPLAERAERYVKLGIHPDDAPQFAKIFQAELTPLQQENQHLRAQLQGSTIAQQVMQAATDANPELFADPSIAREVWANVQQTAQQGNLQALTPEYAKFLAAQSWALKHEPWKTNGQPTLPAQPMPGFRPAGLPPISFGGTPGQYPPPPAMPSNQPSPQQAQLAAEMAAYLKLPQANS